MFDHATTLPLAFWLLAVAATVLVGMSKAGFGGAAGSLGVPLMALVVAPPFAAAVMLPILLTIDAIGLVVFRGRGDAANLRIILPGAMIGIALGWLTFGHVDARWIKLLIGIEAVLFAFDRFRAARSTLAAVPSAPTFLPGIFWSTLSGFTSFVSHAGGPPIMQYLMPQNMDKLRLVGTTVIFFSVVNFAKLGPYAQLGLLDLSNLGVSLLLAPAIPLGYFVGYRLLHAVDMRGFNLVTAWTLLAAGAKLVYDGLAG
ncbi:MAG: sulfite exporter TauE/SafE family protein [Sulfuritalea sp.]|nr:sulfite exporter TauE/SafE family protein [Sulfuritalea sp.]